MRHVAAHQRYVLSIDHSSPHPHLIMYIYLFSAVAHHGLPPSPIPFTISLPMPSDNIEHGNIHVLSEYLNQDVTSVIQAKEKGGSGDYNGNVIAVAFHGITRHVGL